MVAVIFYSPLLFQTRVAHITRRRRIELAHLLAGAPCVVLFLVLAFLFLRALIVDDLHMLGGDQLYAVFLCPADTAL